MEPEEGNMEEQQESREVFSLDVSRERVESLWRQVLSQKSSGRADLAAAKASRAQAEMERQRISSEALSATQEACMELIEESERQLSEGQGCRSGRIPRASRSEREAGASPVGPVRGGKLPREDYG